MEWRAWETVGVSKDTSTSGFSFLIETLRCFFGGGRVELFEGTEVLSIEAEVVVMEDEEVKGVVEVEARLSLRKARGSPSSSSSILSARSRRFGL